MTRVIPGEMPPGGHTQRSAAEQAQEINISRGGHYAADPWNPTPAMQRQRKPEPGPAHETERNPRFLYGDRYTSPRRRS